MVTLLLDDTETIITITPHLIWIYDTSGILWFPLYLLAQVGALPTVIIKKSTCKTSAGINYAPENGQQVVVQYSYHIWTVRREEFLLRVYLPEPCNSLRIHRWTVPVQIVCCCTASKTRRRKRGIINDFFVDNFLIGSVSTFNAEIQRQEQNNKKSKRSLRQLLHFPLPAFGEFCDRTAAAEGTIIRWDTQAVCVFVVEVHKTIDRPEGLLYYQLKNWPLMQQCVDRRRRRDEPHRGQKAESKQ